MRTISSQQDKVLQLSNRTTKVKVEIFYTPSSTWIDMTSLYGFDWVDSVTVTDSVDNPTATATIALKRAIYKYVLSPLVANSKPNVSGALVDIYKKVRISCAVVPKGATPGSSDWVNIFEGRSYSVDWAGDLIQVECRDYGGDLVDGWIETIVARGAVGGRQSESVMQDILTTQGTLWGTTLTLYSVNGTGGTPFLGGDSPGWAINSYQQQQMPTLTALQTLADQIAWQVRYRWQKNVGGWQLVFFDPRAGVTSLRSFASSQYFSFPSLKISQEQIRNGWVVSYRDTSGNQQTLPVVIDSTSISKYGRKWARISEDQTSQINTSTEATKMANGALNDTSQPLMNQQVEMPLFWPVETGDTYTFKANGIHYDADQLLSVTGWKHEFSKDKAHTTLTLNGKPVGRVATWFDKMTANVTKQFGAANISTTSIAQTSIYPNSNFSQYSRG